MSTNLFNFPAFFIILRESLECTLIITILISLIDRFVSEENQQKKIIKRKIWIGVGLGIILSIIIGAVFLSVYLIIEKNNWEQTNEIWEMVFSFFATFLMTMMAFNMIRITNWKDKIEKKLNKIISNYLCRNRRQQLPLLLLPFTVICRESLETFIFITGIEAKAYSLPIPILAGISTGLLIAGFFSSACYELEGILGSKEIIIWELNCCVPSGDNGWTIAEKLFVTSVLF
ncbi:808_t:CDS:2 [Rhizophagus irregularis]|nr:808_t:CDS:2 [Rhizophagus irregularis]